MPDQYIYELTDTWSSGVTSYNGIKLNVADAASAADSKLLNLQIGGVEKLAVDKAGNLLSVGYIPDDKFRVADNGDKTKLLAFELSSLTTGTTRTVTWPDASLTVVGTATTQTLSNKTLASPDITGRALIGTYTYVSTTASGEAIFAENLYWDGSVLKVGQSGGLGWAAIKLYNGSVQIAGAAGAVTAGATITPTWRDVTDTSTAQTLTNKTLTSPTVFTASIEDDSTFFDPTDTTKRFRFDGVGVSTATTRVITVPNANTTLVGTDTAQTLASKTLASPTVTGTMQLGTLANAEGEILARSIKGTDGYYPIARYSVALGNLVGVSLIILDLPATVNYFKVTLAGIGTGTSDGLMWIRCAVAGTSPDTGASDYFEQRVLGTGGSVLFGEGAADACYLFNFGANGYTQSVCEGHVGTATTNWNVLVQSRVSTVVANSIEQRGFTRLTTGIRRRLVIQTNNSWGLGEILIEGKA